MSRPVNTRSIHEKLTNDLQYFCEKAPLIIKDKDGKLIPLKFNFVQRKIHAALENQLQDKGWVRALIVKPRQPGCSTYVQARFYQKTTRGRGINTFILSHLSDATENIYSMVERFQSNIHEAIKIPANISNRRRMKFDGIDAEYQVGTAGSKGLGRSATIRLFHWSEVAHSENTDGIESGVMQTVPLNRWTEIILESTANGMGDMFHRRVQEARAGKGDYIVIFISWFEHDEYQREVPKDFKITQEEGDLKELYDLSDEQIYWRRLKIEDIGDWKFKQEYPSNLDEAFQTSGDNLIPVEAILNARKSDIRDPTAPLIMGVDPASERDRAAVCFRRGRTIPKVYTWEKRSPMELVAIIAKLIKKHEPAQCFIDIGEGGRAIADRLGELGFRKTVTGVNFGSKPIDDEQYLNKRAEMWCDMKDWFVDGDCSMPDEDVIQSDLCMMPEYKLTSSSRIQLVSKDELRKLYKKSPDIGDAIALTFAFPVANDAFMNTIRKDTKPGQGVSTLKRWRKLGS